MNQIACLCMSGVVFSAIVTSLILTVCNAVTDLSFLSVVCEISIRVLLYTLNSESDNSEFVLLRARSLALKIFQSPPHQTPEYKGLIRGFESLRSMLRTTGLKVYRHPHSRILTIFHLLLLHTSAVYSALWTAAWVSTNLHTHWIAMI